MTFDFSCVDWSDDDSSPFDHCGSSSCDDESFSETSSLLSACTMMRSPPKVRFAQDDEVFEIVHIKDYRPLDIQATWYRPDELREMRSHVQHEVFLMEERKDLARESNSFTKRGLETRTSEGSLKRAHQRLKATAAVLEAQRKLWDPELIATAYRNVSAKCLGMALLQGIQDHHDVRDHSRVQQQVLPVVSSSSSTVVLSSEQPQQPATATLSAAAPSKPYEAEMMSERLAVLEDIKILSGASEMDLWPASPAAA